LCRIDEIDERRHIYKITLHSSLSIQRETEREDKRERERERERDRKRERKEKERGFSCGIAELVDLACLRGVST